MQIAVDGVNYVDMSTNVNYTYNNNTKVKAVCKRAKKWAYQDNYLTNTNYTTCIVSLAGIQGNIKIAIYDDVEGNTSGQNWYTPIVTGSWDCPLNASCFSFT